MAWVLPKASVMVGRALRMTSQSCGFVDDVDKRIDAFPDLGNNASSFPTASCSESGERDSRSTGRATGFLRETWNPGECGPTAGSYFFARRFDARHLGRS